MLLKGGKDVQSMLDIISAAVARHARTAKNEMRLMRRHVHV